MSEDMTNLIGNLLKNPDALKGLMSSSSPDPGGDSRADLESSVATMMSALNNADDRRINLLTAVKPFMSPGRASGIDKAIQILKLTKLTEIMRTERK